MKDHASHSGMGERLQDQGWQRFAEWSLTLASTLIENNAKRGGHRKQKLVDAVSRQFTASTSLTITTISQDGTASVEVERFESTATNETPTVIDGQEDRLSNDIALQDGRHATITLIRGSNEPTFTEVDARRLRLVHAGCAWIYSTQEPDIKRRMRQLAPRERQTLDLLVLGKAEKEIAAEMGRSPHTVHSYVKRIYRTLGLRSRSELREAFRENARSDERLVSVPQDE